MGLVNKLAQKYATAAIMEAIQEKSPPIYKFIDSLDEVSLSEAIGILLEEDLRYNTKLIPGEMLTIDEVKNKINTTEYIIRFAKGKEPALNVLLDLIKELGIKEIAGIEVKDFLLNLTETEE